MTGEELGIVLQMAAVVLIAPEVAGEKRIDGLRADLDQMNIGAHSREHLKLSFVLAVLVIPLLAYYLFGGPIWSLLIPLFVAYSLVSLLVLFLLFRGLSRPLEAFSDYLIRRAEAGRLNRLQARFVRLLSRLLVGAVVFMYVIFVGPTWLIFNLPVLLTRHMLAALRWIAIRPRIALAGVVLLEVGLGLQIVS